MTFVDFDTEVRVARYSQDDFARLIERIRGRRPRAGWTALYDAIGVYLDGAGGQDGRKIMLLYTDGGDNRSSMQLQRAAQPPEGVGRDRLRDRRARAPVVDRPQGEQRMILQQIAEHDRRPGVLSALGEGSRQRSTTKVLAEIRAQYTLGYVSTNDTHRRRLAQGRDQGRAQGAGYRVRARKGYFAPYKPGVSGLGARDRQSRVPSPDRHRIPNRQSRPAFAVWYDCGCHALAVRPLQPRVRFRARRRPAARDRGARRGAGARRHAPGAARRHRLGQDVHDGADHRAREPPDAGDGPQQDAGGAALPGVPPLLPRQRRRVLRQLLRLLPARGVRPRHRHVHREGSDDQRRDRPHAALGHALALRAPRRHHRGQRVVHLRPRVARGVLRHAAAARARPADRRASRSCASWSKSSTSATTTTSGAAPSACAATSSRSIPSYEEQGAAHRAVRRRSRRARHLRPAHRQDAPPPRQDRHLPEVALRHAARADEAGGRDDQGGAGLAPRRSSRRRASCSRRSGSTSGRCSTSR